MIFYPLIREIIFQLDPEISHNLVMNILHHICKNGKLYEKIQCLLPLNKEYLPKSVMGINFPNPVGLAAGMDKNGEYLEVWKALGFGFVEVGTVTPLPQAGNSKPRLFRLPTVQGLINRLGFNNLGIDYLIEQIKKSNYDGILGINIGKNATTPITESVNDYLICMRKAYMWADYITINISSPNTIGLRNLQIKENLNKLLDTLKSEQHILSNKFGRYVPLAIKIDPDLSNESITSIASIIIQQEIDAVIATNTTISRNMVNNVINAKEYGGLSGKPLLDISTIVVKKLSDLLLGRVPIIAVGGIMSGHDAVVKVNNGASLVQLYTGLIYHGPGLISDVINNLKRLK